MLFMMPPKAQGIIGFTVIAHNTTAEVAGAGRKVSRIASTKLVTLSSPLPTRNCGARLAICALDVATFARNAAIFFGTPPIGVGMDDSPLGAHPFSEVAS